MDAGVYEMKVSWKRYTRYAEDAVILARRFFANGTPIDSENGEGGEDAKKKGIRNRSSYIGNCKRIKVCKRGTPQSVREAVWCHVQHVCRSNSRSPGR